MELEVIFKYALNETKVSMKLKCIHTSFAQIILLQKMQHTQIKLNYIYKTSVCFISSIV